MSDRILSNDQPPQKFARLSWFVQVCLTYSKYDSRKDLEPTKIRIKTMNGQKCLKSFVI